MKTKLLGTALALGLAAAPFAATAGGVGGGNAASDWTIYGWQNYSYEFVDIDGPDFFGEDRDFDRIQGNAANIGFSASIDTGMQMGGEAVKVNLRCEQFTFHNRLTSSGWCNRNSKLSLSGSFGEIMVGQWLLPFNEMVAQWVDPFYDAGADSHTSIMGNIGAGGTFYNGGVFPLGDGTDFDYEGQYALSFNRRQEGIVQYWSPNMNGFHFRVAVTSGRDNERTNRNGDEVDPRIWSGGIAYENTLANGDNLWLAATYEQHEDYTAWQLAAPGDFAGGIFNLSTGSNIVCEESDDQAWRLAGRYIKQWGNGMSTQISAMYEDLEYDADGCSVTNIWEDTERTAWMISGKQTFGNGFDFRFSYMDADELDCGGATCGSAGIFSGTVDEDETDAKAFNLGLFYTMPAGTELRLTYSEVDNSDDSNYDFGIGGSNLFNDADDDDDVDVSMFAIGLVQWF